MSAMTDRNIPSKTVRELLDDAIAAMTALHEAAEPQTDCPDIPALIPAGAFRTFVDAHAALLYGRAHLPDETSDGWKELHRAVATWSAHESRFQTLGPDYAALNKILAAHNPFDSSPEEPSSDDARDAARYRWLRQARAVYDDTRRFPQGQALDDCCDAFISNQDGHRSDEPSSQGGFGTAAREPSSAQPTFCGRFYRGSGSGHCQLATGHEGDCGPKQVKASCDHRRGVDDSGHCVMCDESIMPPLNGDGKQT